MNVARMELVLEQASINAEILKMIDASREHLLWISMMSVSHFNASVSFF